MNKENLTLSLAAAALVVSVAGTGGPALARAVVDADKVDGLSAVKASAPKAQRKGKLVATSPTTGRLPDSVLGRAADSARLGGVPAAQLRSVPLPATGGDYVGGASGSGGGAVQLPDAGTPRVTVSLVLPADYRAGAPLRVAADLATAPGGCSVLVTATGGTLVASAGTVVPATFTVNGAAAPAQTTFGPVPGGGSLSVLRTTFRATSPAFQAGRTVLLQVGRGATSPLDNCTGDALLTSFVVTY